MSFTAGLHDPLTPPRIGFLGPEGTFTEQAVLREADLATAEHVPFPLMTEVLFAVADGRVELGVVPVENAIEGTVNATVDTMAFDVDVSIQRELVQQVSFELLAVPGATIEGIERVVSIPVASAQCRTWLRGELPEVTFTAAGSTAEAAATVAGSGDPSVAAIANARAGEVYGLRSLAGDIEDHPENRTRFVVVGASGIPAPTGHDKTSIVVFQQRDRPGSLLAILQEFAARSINLTLLLSRPTKTSLGRLLLRDRPRGPRRGSRRGRLPADAARHAGRREVPRLLPGGGRARPGGAGAGRRGVRRRRGLGRGPTPPDRVIRTRTAAQGTGRLLAALRWAAEGWQSGRLRRS